MGSVVSMMCGRALFFVLERTSKSGFTGDLILDYRINACFVAKDTNVSCIAVLRGSSKTG